MVEVEAQSWKVCLGGKEERIAARRSRMVGVVVVTSRRAREAPKPNLTWSDLGWVQQWPTATRQSPKG